MYSPSSNRKQLRNAGVDETLPIFTLGKLTLRDHIDRVNITRCCGTKTYGWVRDSSGGGPRRETPPHRRTEQPPIRSRTRRNTAESCTVACDEGLIIISENRPSAWGARPGDVMSDCDSRACVRSPNENSDWVPRVACPPVFSMFWQSTGSKLPVAPYFRRHSAIIVSGCGE